MNFNSIPKFKNLPRKRKTALCMKKSDFLGKILTVERYADGFD